MCVFTSMSYVLQILWKCTFFFVVVLFGMKFCDKHEFSCRDRGGRACGCCVPTRRARCCGVRMNSRGSGSFYWLYKHTKYQPSVSMCARAQASCRNMNYGWQMANGLHGLQFLYFHFLELSCNMEWTHAYLVSCNEFICRALS